MEIDEKYSKILDKIMSTYSKEQQVLQTIEEMSELTKELLKNINRKENNETEIILEIADVLIMLAQMLSYYNIDEEKLQGAIEYKLLRQNKRIEKMKKSEAINILIEEIVKDKEIIKQNLLNYSKNTTLTTENYKIEINLKEDNKNGK